MTRVPVTARRLAPLVLVLSTVGCVVAQGDSPDHEEARQSVFGPVSTAHPELGWFIAESQVASTATLVAPRLVVVALHSITRYLGGDTTGSVSTADSNCPVLGEYTDKSSFVIKFPSGDRTVEQIITNGQRTLCDGDFAFLVLNEPVDAPTAPLRLQPSSQVGEATQACGLGDFDVQCTHDQKTVHCSDGTVKLPSGGYFAPGGENVPPTFMVTDNAICLGDSGSPLFSKTTGAIIGTISGSISDPTVLNSIEEPCKVCTGGSSLTALFSARPDYVARAFASVGLAPWREGHDKPVDLGARCGEALDCNSQLCVGLGDTSVCSQYCSAEHACQAGFDCTSAGQESVCLPAVKPDPQACSASTPGLGRAPLPFGLAAFAALLFVARRRRTGRQR